MKKLTKKGLIIIAVLVSYLGYAHDLREPVKEKEPKVTNLKLAKVRQGSMLFIKDLQGLILYKEAIAHSGSYSKGFDLTSLPNGDYFFELDTEMEIVVIPFEVRASEVEFKKEEKSTIFKPVIRVKDDLVLMSRTDFDGAPLECKIYYAENADLVLSEKFEDQQVVERVYDFSTAKKGNYVFVFHSNGRKYVKSVKI